MRYKLTNVKAIDGDSIKGTICLGFDSALINVSIRLKNIDTPETRTRNKLEKKAGKLVTAWVKGKIKTGLGFHLETGRTQFDCYGRPLGVLLIDGEDICLELLKRRFAVSYQGEKKKPWKLEQLEYIINQLTKEV